MRCPHCGGDITAAFRKHGATGGLKSAAKLTKAKRKARARKAAAARWKGHKKAKRNDEA